ncbi:hypothetical protein BKI52_37230 [marine bacterium AO1-C]|nr:hypothetical protein BKI52_37230 [marine bacterium AO1-C]
MGKLLPKSIFALLLFLGLGLGNNAVYGQAAQVKILSAVLDPLSEKINITYHLVEPKKRNLNYNVNIYYSTDLGKSFIGPMKVVSGDVGQGVPPGTSKQISWDFMTEAPTLAEKGNTLKLQFRIIAEVDPASAEAYKKRLGGPGNAFLSLLIPGAGNHKVRPGTNGYGAITFLTWGALGTGLIFRLSAQRNYERYLESNNTSELDHFFFLAESHHKASRILITSAIVIWALDVALVAYQGFRNLKKRRAISLFNKKIYPSLGLGYNTQFNQPNIGLSLKF